MLSAGPYKRSHFVREFILTRWPVREKEFLASCKEDFEVGSIPAELLTMPGVSKEELGSGAIRAVVMVRLPTPSA